MRRGPLYMTLAALAFTAMIACVKVVRVELSSFDALLWRGLLTLPVVWLWAARRGGLRIRQPMVMFGRVSFGFGAMFCVYTATKGLALADLTLITKLQPLLVALAAPALLGAGERATKGLWMVLVVGLAGCAILLSPQLDVGLTFGLIAIAGALFSTMGHLCVRALGKTEQPATVVFWFQFAVVLYAAVGLTVTTGAPVRLPPDSLWPYLVGCAVAGTIGQMLLTSGYKADPAPRVAAAAYTGPLWAALVDAVAFGVFPNGYVLVGGALIVGAGLWLLFAQPPAPSRRTP